MFRCPRALVVVEQSAFVSVRSCDSKNLSCVFFALTPVFFCPAALLLCPPLPLSSLSFAADPSGRDWVDGLTADCTQSHCSLPPSSLPLHRDGPPNRDTLMQRSTAERSRHTEQQNEYRRWRGRGGLLATHGQRSSALHACTALCRPVAHCFRLFARRCCLCSRLPSLLVVCLTC